VVGARCFACRGIDEDDAMEVGVGGEYLGDEEYLSRRVSLQGVEILRAHGEIAGYGFRFELCGCKFCDREDPRGIQLGDEC